MCHLLARWSCLEASSSRSLPCSSLSCIPAISCLLGDKQEMLTTAASQKYSCPPRFPGPSTFAAPPYVYSQTLYNIFLFQTDIKSDLPEDASTPNSAEILGQIGTRDRMPHWVSNKAPNKQSFIQLGKYGHIPCPGTKL